MTVSAITGGIPTELYNPFNTGKGKQNTTSESVWSNPHSMGYGLNYGLGFDFDMYDMSYMGSFGGYPSFCGGFPMFGGTGDLQAYWNKMDEYNQAITNNQIKQRERIRNSELQYNAPAENVNIAMKGLKSKIESNNQDQILAAYEKYKEAVKAMYGGTDEQVAARARTLYEQTNNISLIDDIRKNGNGSFTQAFLQSTSGGWGVDDTSAEYNISQITGQEIGRADRENKILGHATGGIVKGGLLGSMIGFISGILLKNPKAGASIGALIGSIGFGIYDGKKGSEKFK